MRPFRKCGSFVVRFPDGRPSKYFYWDDLPSRRLRPDLVTSEVLGAGQKRLLELSASGWDDDNSASPCHPAEFDAGRMFKRPQLTDDACVCAAVPTNRTSNCRDRSRSRRRNKANRPPANFCRSTDRPWPWPIFHLPKRGEPAAGQTSALPFGFLRQRYLQGLPIVCHYGRVRNTGVQSFANSRTNHACAKCEAHRAQGGPRSNAVKFGYPNNSQFCAGLITAISLL